MTAANRKELIYPELSYQLVGILFAVHNELGRNKTEKQYGDAVEHRLRECSVPYEREKTLPTSFAGEQPGRNKADFVIDGKMLLEIKAKRFLTREDYLQTKRYLEASRIRLTLLVNFRQRYLLPKRIVLGYS